MQAYVEVLGDLLEWCVACLDVEEVDAHLLLTNQLSWLIIFLAVGWTHSVRLVSWLDWSSPVATIPPIS